MKPPSTPINVLMTTDSVGGIWTYALELAAAAAPLGVRYSLACLGPEPSASQLRQLAQTPNVTLFTHEGKLEWMADPWSDVDDASRWLLELEEDVSPDVVHLNSYSYAAAGFQAPVLTVAHSCVFSWWRAVRGTEPPAQWQEYHARVRQGLSRTDALVAPTRWMLSQIEQHYPPRVRGRVIPNAVVNRAPPAEKEPIVAAAGRVWDQAKNIEGVARAVADTAWPCHIAGDDGGAAAEFPNVTLLGLLPQSEVWSLFSRASIFAHPARYEPFGLAPLEAAHAGCALVLGDIPTLQEVWKDAALFVPPEDSVALATALQRLMDDGPLRRELAGRAFQRAQRLTTDRFARSYAGLYSALTARMARAADTA